MTARERADKFCDLEDFGETMRQDVTAMIEAAILEERAAATEIVQKFANGQFIYQEAADLIIRDIQKRGQS